MLMVSQFMAQRLPKHQKVRSSVRLQATKGFEKTAVLTGGWDEWIVNQ